MLTHAARSLWAEPRAPGRTGPGVRDGALVAVFAVAAVVETLARPDLVWRPASLLLALAAACTLPWRRTHPFVTVAVAFGVVSVADVVALARDVEWEGLGSGACLLLLPYALTRWGSGREMAGGIVLVALPLVLTAAGGLPAGDIVGGTVVLALALALGAGARYQRAARQQELDSIRSRERERLARELHDTVAHHVSAIAIQAQAGRALAPTRPAAAAEALVVIEEEASRTLEEMRSMVGALRQGEPVDLAPPQGVGDLTRLARTGGQDPPVDVELTGDLDDLRTAVDAALYRLAREAVTNSLRHARHATSVRVRVCGHPDRVVLSVEDDGQGGSSGPAGSGFGLVGMAERAKLLGGTLEAGPGPDGGWRVRAVLPRARRVVTVRVVIADDQDIVRAGLRMILDAQPGIEVVGEAADGRAAVALARRLRPDVCLFDIRMPELDGIAATRQLAGPDVADPLAVVVITTFDLDDYVLGALKAGARGFLLKDAGPELLAQAVHAAANGDALIAPSVTARLLSTFVAVAANTSPVQPVEPLTDREEEVLLTVARGRTNLEIADELAISLSTVKTHLASLMTKLHARNRVELAMWAYETRRLGP